MSTPTYAAIHTRLRYRFGPAKGYVCASCDGQAEQWAYDNADPDELTQDYFGTTLRYSAQLSHYLPLCRPCHREFDELARDMRTTGEPIWPLVHHRLCPHPDVCALIGRYLTQEAIHA